MWVAQLIGESSEAVALSRFQQMQRELRSALGSYEPAILRTTLKDGTIWVRVRVEFDTRQAAEALVLQTRSCPQALFRAAKLRRCPVNEDLSRLEVIAKGVVERRPTRRTWSHPVRPGGNLVGERGCRA